MIRWGRAYPWTPAYDCKSTEDLERASKKRSERAYRVAETLARAFGQGSNLPADNCEPEWKSAEVQETSHLRHSKVSGGGFFNQENMIRGTARKRKRIFSIVPPTKNTIFEQDCIYPALLYCSYTCFLFLPLPFSDSFLKK
jgi:hypothetical protein